jgi:hypothetical protein
MRSIYENRTHKEGDQIIMLHILKQNPNTIKIMALNTLQFPNGLIYFNELHDNPKYRELQIKFRQSILPVYFVHANWMIGMETKINALKKKGLWFV